MKYGFKVTSSKQMAICCQQNAEGRNLTADIKHQLTAIGYPLSAFCCLFTAILCGALPATAQSRSVASIQIEGNRRIDASALGGQIKTSPQNVTQESVTADIKALYETGFFDQVSASIVEPVAKNEQRVLKFTLVEKPVVRKVYFTGNEKVESSELEGIIKLEGRRFLDRTQLKTLADRAVSYYQGHGYYDAAVDYSVVPVADNQVDLNFTINEGLRFQISDLTIAGLVELDEDDLLDKLQTREYSWWKSWLLGTGRLNREMLDNDLNILRQALLDEGFVDGKVGEPMIEKRDGRLVISIAVEEGKRYKFGTVSASGDLLNGSVEETIKDIKFEPGDTFSAAKLRDSTFIVSDKFTDVGYAYANVSPDTQVDRYAEEVNINFIVSKGDPVTVNRINIRGNEKSYDNVIRRELTIAEQELYSSSKVRRSQTLLQRLGYFEEVSVTTADTPNKDKDKVDLLVNVREASTGTLSAGAGYSSSDGALFNIRASENNLFGTGRRVNLNLDVGDERNNQVLSFDDPRVNDSRWALGIDAIRTERDFSDFDRKQVGGAVTGGHPLEPVFGKWAQDMRFSLQYQYIDVEIDDVDPAEAAQLVIDSQGRTSASMITPTISRNTIDNPLSPRRGSNQSISVELAGLGGEESYYLFEASNQWYQPLFNTPIGEFIFSLRTRVGYGETYDDDPFPLFRRYFPGGINSVRGFENRTLGPTDENGNEYGGSKQFVNNAELIFPLVESAGLKGVVFFDVGEAFDDDVSIDFGELRQAYGYGIRWTSPLGPIRIEFGFPLDKEDDEDSMVTMFSFGAPL